jgi:DNA invertase Pin-like site-specific DNA recombinase
MRVALYGRVSTATKGQDPEAQLRELREWCRAAGHDVVAEFIEAESGRKGAARRSQLAAAGGRPQAQI